ncbi:pseudaminic acid biosynthesis-associated methylase [Polynucleobacter paneuropaeus]|jgi:spore coat polysaccharide biosynthesis protein SpsF|nr:pseudaminic acid biosynthesis-associated methylase [Polynucleobacter paneuropaeus]MBT8576708.1 pseudaminic acid biosynthesis-associated methylase [Polynucleobacter paneuropaeus]
MNFKTEQESFWAGEFGNKYINRNQGANLLASNISFFSKALGRAGNIKAAIEFGANIGMNLQALKLLYPAADFHAIEINPTAVSQLQSLIPSSNIYQDSILNWTPPLLWDLVLIKGVLIHINPEHLPQVYEKLVASTSKYLLVAEYYNPTPVTISYRGHNDRLFKRDFAGELMGLHSEMKLIDYGFAYHNDTKFPQDDITFFLMEKIG